MEYDFDVVVIGGGASGTALFYTLARYTNAGRIALIEKHPQLGIVNSKAVNNSQTLHVGDIETNYSIQKAREVFPAAMMVKCYTDTLSPRQRDTIIRPMQKMVLAVGAEEVETLRARYDELRYLFPTIKLLDAAGIRTHEPEVMRGRDPKEPVSALMNPHGYAVDFGALADSFAKEALQQGGERVKMFLDEAVLRIERTEGGHRIVTAKRSILARAVVVDADAYSLSFAKALGYGKEFSLIPIAGTFFFSDARLRGKVYRVQDPRMPFAAVHGDPDLTKEGVTRWGPTARFYPVLEARDLRTMLDFFRASGFERIATWVSFAVILFDPVRFWYLLRNLFYDMPLIGTRFLLPELRKIIPTLNARDLTRAAGYGGMRLQRVDTKARKMLLGEGKIVGSGIIFNMTPSPGASVSLYNAMRDADRLTDMLPGYRFDKERMAKDLCLSKEPLEGADPSLTSSYAS